MGGRLIIVLISIFLILLFIRWFLRTPPQQVARRLKKIAVWLVIALLLLLAVSGRLHWLFALIGTLLGFMFTNAVRWLPLLRYVPALKQWFQRNQQSTTSQGPSQSSSQVTTDHLRMQLNHATGELFGEVLHGRFAGSSLADLNRTQLLTLFADYQEYDAESAHLLQAYLDSIYGEDWHAEHVHADSPSTSHSEMTEDEALDILGLSTGASEAEIIQAHRSLMQKLHPDRGGSDYLAAKINTAKKTLLGK